MTAVKIYYKPSSLKQLKSILLQLVLQVRSLKCSHWADMKDLAELYSLWKI